MSRFEGSGERPTCPEGYYNATIVDFVDITERVSQYADWAFEVKLNAEDVSFELKSSYFIKFARLGNGELDVDNNGWSKQFNNLLDTINFTGGFDRFGVFRDATGEEIEREDILTKLCQHIIDNFKEGEYPFIIYVEKDDKGYMRPMKRIYMPKDRAELISFVDYKKKNAKKPPVGQQRNRI